MKKELHKRRRKFVGILLQIERECLKLDQKDIAQMLGVRQEWISKIEVGTRRLDVIELIDYCEALNLTLTEFAAKIESRLFAERLLPRRRRQINESGETKKIRVDISWCENKFSASLGVNVPGIGVFTAETFVDLQIDVEASLAFHIERLVANGNEVPQWLKNKEYEFEYKFLDEGSFFGRRFRCRFFRRKSFLFAGPAEFIGLKAFGTDLDDSAGGQNSGNQLRSIQAAQPAFHLGIDTCFHEGSLFLIPDLFQLDEIENTENEYDGGPEDIKSKK